MPVDDDYVDIPFDVLPPEHGIRADVFLARRLRRLSRSRAADIVREGNLRKQGGEPLEKPSQRVFSGERLLLKRQRLEEAPIDDIVVPEVYEDEDILAVNKPGNLVVHPTASAYSRTLIRVLWARRADAYLSLAHRIDKETSGLVLLAKNRDAERVLKLRFAERDVKKSYLAIVRGRVEADELHLTAPMRLVPNSESLVLMEIGGAGAQAAETSVRVLSRGRDATLVEARPRTGRQHQIRLHLAHAGHPILGDKLYLGGESFFIRALNGEVDEAELDEVVGHRRQALHAFSAALEHPRRGTPMSLAAPLAPDLQELAARHELPVSVAAYGEQG